MTYSDEEESADTLAYKIECYKYLKEKLEEDMLNNKKLNFELPKFRKGQIAKANGLKGTIEDLTYTGGENWYFVNGKYYGEGEITKI